MTILLLVAVHTVDGVQGSVVRDQQCLHVGHSVGGQRDEASVYRGLGHGGGVPVRGGERGDLDQVLEDVAPVHGLVVVPLSGGGVSIDWRVEALWRVLRHVEVADHNQQAILRLCVGVGMKTAYV